MLNCLNCQASIEKRRTGTKDGKPIYRKFCDRKCAAIYNNKVYKKRSLEGSCKVCGVSCPSAAAHCQKCKPDRYDYLTVTIKEVKGRAKYQKSAIIRAHARKTIRQAGLPRRCNVCGYDKHVEVSHIRPISSFDLDTLISVVNHVSNLEYLCPNHHWEHENSLKV